MKILHLSDTHGAHRHLHNLPEADIVVHSEDFTMTGSEAEAIDFLNWFCDLPYKQKIFIGGNHDMCMYGANIGGLDSNVHYLCNSGIKIDGIKFYGVPMFMEDCVTDRQAKFYNNISSDIVLGQYNEIAGMAAHLIFLSTMNSFKTHTQHVRYFIPYFKDMQSDIVKPLMRQPDFISESHYKNK